MGQSCPAETFLNVTSKRTILSLARPPHLKGQLWPQSLFFDSYSGYSSMPKETASPQQLTEKGEVEVWEPHECVYREMNPWEGLVVFSQREGFRQKGRREMLKARSLRTDKLVLTRNKLRAEAAEAMKQNTWELFLYKSLTFPNKPPLWITLLKTETWTHPVTAWLSHSKNLSLGLPGWFWPIFKTRKNSLCDGTASRRTLTGLSAVFSGQESHQSQQWKPFQGSAEPTWWRVNSLLSSKRILSSGQKPLPILSSSVTMSMSNK